MGCQDCSPISESRWGREVNPWFIQTAAHLFMPSFPATTELSSTSVILKVGFPRTTATATPGHLLAIDFLGSLIYWLRKAGWGPAICSREPSTWLQWVLSLKSIALNYSLLGPSQDHLSAVNAEVKAAARVLCLSGRAGERRPWPARPRLTRFLMNSCWVPALLAVELGKRYRPTLDS